MHLVRLVHFPPDICGPTSPPDTDADPHRATPDIDADPRRARPEGRGLGVGRGLGGHGINVQQIRTATPDPMGDKHV